MADKKIADLQEATTATDTDILVIQDNANTKKITWANLKTAIIGAFSSILGNRTYTEQNVVTNNDSITKSINDLDVSLASQILSVNSHLITRVSRYFSTSELTVTITHPTSNYVYLVVVRGNDSSSFGYYLLSGYGLDLVRNNITVIAQGAQFSITHPNGASYVMALSATSKTFELYVLAGSLPTVTVS